jgi:hypothetical protein
VIDHLTSSPDRYGRMLQRQQVPMHDVLRA